MRWRRSRPAATRSTERSGWRFAIRLDLIYHYTSNLALYPAWHAYMREHQPPTLIAWGANDQYFVADGARAYLADVPNAELHLLDTGHFALVTHAAHIAELIAAFHARHAAAAGAESV